eukprot:GILJ01009526.1.p1 GENE.GILJ01009526.1~~GILJ01009526.1.p1  ORF type:complete len:279 (+),score=35.27 GILJ01009526.1:94-930(+)
MSTRDTDLATEPLQLTPSLQGQAGSTDHSVPESKESQLFDKKNVTKSKIKRMTLSEEDVASVDGWLTDQILSFYFKYLKRERCPHPYRQNIKFIDPAISFLVLSSSSLREIRTVLMPLKLESRDLIFFPVNNNVDMQGEGGSHWSLIVFIKATRTFHSFDSLQGSNREPSRVLYEKLSAFLTSIDVPGPFEFVIEATPQQINSSDCGVYVIAIAEELLRRYLGEQSDEMNVASEQHYLFVKKMRDFIYRLISSKMCEEDLDGTGRLISNTVHVQVGGK